MRYEFSPIKDIRNFGKHGLSLAAAHGFEWYGATIREDTRKQYGERRFEPKGYLGGRLHVMIFCPRDHAVRVISLRKANAREVNLMPKLRPGTVIPTDEEDVAINAGIAADPDARELDDEWHKGAQLASEFFEPEVFAALVAMKGQPARLKADEPKVLTAVRLDADLVNVFKSTGKGWQTRVNAALRQYLAEHPLP